MANFHKKFREQLPLDWQDTVVLIGCLIAVLALIAIFYYE